MKMEDRIKKTIYKHFGKPKNIVKERVSIYKEYSSPAGYKSPDFKLGDWQMGRMSVFTEKVLLNGDGSKSGLMTSEIKGDCEGTWFFGHTDTELKIIPDKGKHIILELLGGE
tara:strand:- start:563 stop:898 length:336 start_codon:yes stop_codon:yes gene_type:complete